MYLDRIEHTIVALATSEGSTIGIIRVSGKRAFFIAEQMTSRKQFAPFRATFTTLITSEGTPIDEAIVICFPAPRSYTGEDVVEFHVHGAGLHARSIVDMIVSYGVEPALPGEFSYRSIINGKRGLSDVSVIDELISTTDSTALFYQRKELLSRDVGKLLETLEEQWFHIRTLATAIIDFPEDIMEELPVQQLKSLLEKSKNQLYPILENSRKLSKYRGLNIVIAGKPNVGKSSLFNYFLRENRAIVTDVPGTTRDFITEQTTLFGDRITLIDTAGIRTTADSIEKEGIDLARRQIELADILIYVIDGNIGWTEDDDAIKQHLNHQTVLFAISKIDLIDHIPTVPVDTAIPISLKTGEGIENLSKKLYEAVAAHAPSKELPALTSRWYIRLLTSLVEQLNNFDDSLYEDVALFFHTVKDIHDTFLALLGKDIRDDIYDEIFSSFCIGK